MSTLLVKNVNVLVTMDDSRQEIIHRLGVAAEYKDPETGAHIQRMSHYSALLAKAYGLSKKNCEIILMASPMHDVGKIHIPDHILRKPGSLTSKEWTIMQTHTTAGERIMGDKPFYKVAREIARSHHERWDGSGYPDRLTGKQIPLPARIVTVVDIFDALTHERPYKSAWSVNEALAEMKKLSGKTFDPEILEVFVHTLLNSPSDFV